MFSPHRDYLLAVARDLEVAEVIKPEVEMDVRASPGGIVARRGLTTPIANRS
jgi:hypothetical protein